MSRINVIVASTLADAKAAVIAEHVTARADMALIGGRPMPASQVGRVLESDPALTHVAVVLLGDPVQTRVIAAPWIERREDLVVVLLDYVDDVVRIEGIALRNLGLDAFLATLRDIVDRVGPASTERVVRIDLTASVSPSPDAPSREAHAAGRPLFEASTRWLRALLRDAVDGVPSDNGDVHGLSLTKATLLQMFDTPSMAGAGHRAQDLEAASTALDTAFGAALEQTTTPIEPLAQLARVLDLGPTEFRLVVLALAPEVDIIFQRCLGFLLDDMGRRVGTFGLCAALLDGAPGLREALACTGALERWLVFDAPLGHRPPADEPLRLDPFLARWLLGEPDALAQDPRVRRVARSAPWLGISLLASSRVRAKARALADRLTAGAPRRDLTWVLLNGRDPAGWRALIELGARDRSRGPIRIEGARLTDREAGDADDAGRRVARWARLTGDPLAIDVTSAEDAAGASGESGTLTSFLGAVASLGALAAVVATDEARGVRLLGTTTFDLVEGPALDRDDLLDAIRAAATSADLWLSEEQAATFASRYPLRIDGLEQAMRLARSRSLNYDVADPRLARFTTAAKAIVAEGLSHLADRLDPVFDLDDVVLPPDRRTQLVEIVDNIRLATQVLDDWHFGDRLPYGRGVTALFFGPSGTGKTMAAMGIARRLNIQLLRLDLSRVVSKYIGDTEKNIDQVFVDAERTGAAILIDEADALLGRRSEVKDAHDRYANIEIAFLLQRMEAFDGLAILTTNMKQSLDSAFLRRLRFIIDFPRPDAEARERIWRLCLPDAAHTLSEADVRQVARKIDVTGGHIRQITIRAAFIAAAAGSRIDLSHIAQAAKAELAKLGMPPVDLDAAGRRAA